MKVKDKDEYIKKKDAAEALAKAFTEVPMPVALAEGILDSVPTLDLTEILEESEMCGYNFKELLMFAEACEMQGITEENLRDFCMMAENATQYVIDKIEEELDHKFDKVEEGLDRMAERLKLEEQEVEE